MPDAEPLASRRLAAILAADIVGYSRLVGTDEDAALAALRRMFAEVAEPAVAARGGRIFKTMGDGFLAEFPSAVGAVRCAEEIQRGMAGCPPLVLRVGVHLGDVVPVGDDLLGDGVNIAARIEGVASPGGVALSAAVAEAVRGKLPFALRELGQRELKNIDQPMTVYEIGAPRAAAARPIALPRLRRRQWRRVMLLVALAIFLLVRYLQDDWPF